MQEIHKSDFESAFKLGRAALRDASRIVVDIDSPVLTKCQMQNVHELAAALGIPHREIKSMSFIDADQGASNPTKDQDNCQSCVVSFAVRRRGLNCIAKAYNERNPAMYNLGEKFQNAWVNPKTGKIIEPYVIKGKNDEDSIKKLKRYLSQDGEYVLGFNGKDGVGHVVNVITINGKIIVHDEQISKESNRYSDIDSFCDIDYFELIKIDKAILNVEIVKEVLESF